MKIIDQNGRIGDVTQERENGVFAKPEGIPYEIKGDNLTGIDNSSLITATWWERLPDGSLSGLWFDSPVNGFLNAKEVPGENK